MTRGVSVVVALCTVAVAACSRGSTEPVANLSRPGTVVQGPSANAFAGEWRCVTPSMEFIRLSVASKSSEHGALAALLTFSGVAWEGSGRIEDDAFVAKMAVIHTTDPTHVLVARASDAGTLLVQLRSPAGASLDMAFVRD
ncbi:MAG TPA: hypothetical protein VFZ21_16725 [Gemmatimonadaceae bacterium]|nr:hypothetical protein [Gemmatimonadaceae bacterium]